MADLDISENLINILLLILCFIFLFLIYCRVYMRKENMEADQNYMDTLLEKSINLSTIIDGNKYHLSTVPKPANYTSKNDCLTNLVVLIKDDDKFKNELQEYTNLFNQENEECKNNILNSCKPPSCTPVFGECLRNRNFSNDFNLRKVETNYRIQSVPSALIKSNGKYDTYGRKFVMNNKDNKVCMDEKMNAEGDNMNIELVKDGMNNYIKINNKFISACNDVLIPEYNAYEVCLSDEINKAIKFEMTIN